MFSSLHNLTPYTIRSDSSDIYSRGAHIENNEKPPREGLTNLDIKYCVHYCTQFHVILFLLVPLSGPGQTTLNALKQQCTHRHPN